MGVQEQVAGLEWEADTALSFDEVVAEADRVLDAQDVPAGRMKAAFSLGTYRVATRAGGSVDYRIQKVFPSGYGLLRVSYTAGPVASVRFQVLDADVKRKRVVIMLIPIPVSPWYAPAMAEFRDASARLRVSIESL